MSSSGHGQGDFARLDPTFPENTRGGASRLGVMLAPSLLFRVCEYAPVPLAVAQGRDHRIIFANATFRRLMPGEESIGRTVMHIFPMLAAQDGSAALNDVYACGRPIKLREFQTFLGPDDRSRFWDAEFTPLPGQNGSAEAILITMADVSARVRARKKAEQLAIECERRAQETATERSLVDGLMAHLPVGIAVADRPSVMVRRVSYHGMAMTKRPWEELLQDIPVEKIPERWQIYHLDGTTLARSDEVPLTRATRNGEIVTNEAWLLRQFDGRLVPVLWSAGPIRDSRGEITGGIASWLNIGSLEESGRRLIEMAGRSQLAIEAGRLGMWDYDLANGDLVWSERCKAIFGMPPDTEMSYERFLEAVHPDDRQRVNDAMHRAIDPAGTGDYEVEYRVIWPDGTVRWIAARGRVFFEEAGGLTGPVRMVGTARDVTERVQVVAEKEILVQQKDMLLKEVNHRVNNSLQLIASLLRLQAMAQPPEIGRHLDEARARVQTVAQVHQRLYRSDEFKSVEFAAYLRGLCGDLAKSLGHAYDARLRLTAEPAEVSVEIALPLGLIVNELVTNAFKYAYDERDVRPVEVRFEELAGELRLTVSDHGRGLPAGFDPAGSSGLGMRLVMSLVTQIGAELQVGPGPGTQFTVVARQPALSRPSTH